MCMCVCSRVVLCREKGASLVVTLKLYSHLSLSLVHTLTYVQLVCQQCSVVIEILLLLLKGSPLSDLVIKSE